jgi:hypothetical protein
MWVPVARPSARSLLLTVVLVAVGALAIAALGGFLNLGSVYDSLIRGILHWGPAVIVLSLAIPLLAAIAGRPQLGVLTLAVLTPYDGLLVILKHPAFSEGYKEMLTLYVFLWSVLTVIGKPRVETPRPRYLAPLAFYVVVGLISAVRIGGITGAEGVKTSFFYLLIPLSLWICPLNRKERDWFVSILMVNGVITSLYGLYQQVIGASGLLAMGYQYGISIRTTGPWLRSFSSFRQHSAFGLFLVLVLAVCVPAALDEIHRRRSKLFLLCTPIILLALAFTFVRSAWLGLGVAAVYLAFHRYKVLLFFAPFALVALLVLPLGFEKGAFYSGSFQERQQGWTQNLNRAADPFGNGLGTTGASAEKANQVKGDPNAFFYQPDNNYFKVLYELGVFGVFFFTMMLIAAFLYTRDVEKQVTGLDRSIVIGAGANVLAVIVAAYTAVFFEIFPDDLFFWLMLGVVASCLRDRDLNRTPDPELSTTPSR